ncbi:MAG: hypothetical protein QXJ17_02160 [Nitrososphaeria archaeon]
MAIDKYGEIVCSQCGAVVGHVEETCFEHSTYPASLALQKKSDYGVIHIINSVCGRLGLNNKVAFEARRIAEDITSERARSNSVETAFFSMYMACKYHCPSFCGKLITEFRQIGLKGNGRNCLKVLNKFWAFYKHPRAESYSYLELYLDRLKSNMYIKNYVDILVGGQSSLLWTKVREFSMLLLNRSRFEGYSTRVRVLCVLHIACGKIFKLFGIENPITLDFISQYFSLNKNNLRKAVEKILVNYYENLG